MFAFCGTGFEAAVLKIPAVSSEYDDPKKQIIGFAKFATVAEAVAAKETLNGRRVDMDRGCVLKAEMAKKNLHTKRGIDHSTKAFPYMPNSTFRRRSAPDAVWDAYAAEYYGYMPPVEYEHRNDYHEKHTEYHYLQPELSNQHVFEQPSDVFDPFYSNPLSPAAEPAIFDPFYSNPLSSATEPTIFYDDPLPPAHVEQSFENQSPEPFSQSLPAYHASRGFSSVLYNSEQLLSKNMYDMQLYNNSSPDSNPPCNTLYVGNLPAETVELELYSLFASNAGFKRISFKPRPNGPICFVEVIFYSI